MTPAMEEVESESRERQDLKAPKVSPLLALQALRGHLVHQEEAMMGNLDHQGHLDLQDQAYRGLTGAHRLSIFLDHRDHLERLEYLDTLQG